MASNGRTVVVTGASRGLGLATAAHLHGAGWTVVAAVRSPDDARTRLKELTHTEDRLHAVRLDLEDAASINAAASEVLSTVGAPDGIVHNAGVAGVGALEEFPMDAWEQMFTTNFLGAVRLTKELLPAMRAKGGGRIVLVSSMGGVRGMPGIGAYSASKAALERWGESLAYEIAPFGLGVTALVAGSYKTDILELTTTYADRSGPYAALHAKLETRGRSFMRFARRPDQFAPAVERALDERRPFARHGVGFDARMLLVANRLVPSALLQRGTTMALGIPRPGAFCNHPIRHAVVRPTQEEDTRG